MEEGLPLIWRRLPERYGLKGNYCESCKQAYFPKRLICPNCRRKGKLVERAMPYRGKVVSYTEVFVGPEGFESATPYMLALIELENGVRILSQLVDAQKGKIKVGAKVEKVFRKIVDGNEEGAIGYGYKFKVV